MTNPEAAQSSEVLANLSSIHAEFISTRRFMSADVIAQAIGLIRRAAAPPGRLSGMLHTRRAPEPKAVTAEEFLAALSDGESDPGYKAFFCETLERMKADRVRESLPKQR